MDSFKGDAFHTYCSIELLLASVVPTMLQAQVNSERCWDLRRNYREFTHCCPTYANLNENAI